MAKLAVIVKGLPSVKHVVVLEKFATIPVELNTLKLSDGKAWREEEFLAAAEDPQRPLEFLYLESDWPVYILFSSGTTGSIFCLFFRQSFRRAC
jgi:acyl-coenzyme A synthetase/AMP-(fatty) acid ligase